MAEQQDENASLYAQCPLGQASKDIRVLHVSPGLWSQEIKVKLTTIVLAERPQYEALSYTWGSSSQGRSIVVNKAHHLLVTDNLFNALRRLRSSYSTRIIWVDKVCINQDDLDERSSQVAIMADIYRQASAVNIWLGEPGWTIPLTFSVRLPSRSEARYWNLERWLFWLGAVRNRPKLMDKAISATIPRWHDRAWIVQEYLVARKVYLCYGNVCSVYSPGISDYMIRDQDPMSWGTTPALQALRGKLCHELGYLQHKLHGAGDLDYKAYLARIAEFGWDRTGFGILDMRCRMGSVDASDPRDQVYSLLGLINASEADAIGVDYTTPIPQVYAIATYASIKSRGDFDIFTLIKTRRHSPEFPSWCVDFSANLYMMGSAVQSPPVKKDLEASTTSGPENILGTSQTVEMHQSCRLLSLPAVFVDHILATVPLPQEGLRLTLPLAIEFRNLLRQANTKLRLGQIDFASDRKKLLSLFLSNTSADRDAVDQETCLEALFPEVTSSHQYAADPFSVAMSIFRCWTKLTSFRSFGRQDERDTYAPYGGHVLAIMKHHSRKDGGTALFVSGTGLIGLAPKGVLVGDRIVQIRSYAPFIAIRQHGDFHRFQGQVFIHGLWGPGFLEAFEALGLPQQTITLC